MRMVRVAAMILVLGLLGGPKAQALWGRTYEKGWEPEGFKG